MPTLDFYRRQRSQPMTIGQHHKAESDMVMNATWDNSIESRVGWFFDYYHDPDPRLLRGFNPEQYRDLVPIDIKFLQHTTQTYEKDHITMHIQFRPGQICTVPYYDSYIKMYDMEWPFGLYVLIQNEAGRYDRWMVVDKANTEVINFPTYEVLKCDYCFQYILEGKKMEVAGVLRSQNS